jgi:hypothetical protein
MTSADVRSILSPMLFPLFRIERCDKQEALGIDVVPDVNWILTVSSGCKNWFSNEPAPPASKTSSYEMVARRADISILPEELSTIITSLRDGTDSDSTRGLSRLGIICFSKGMLSLGAFLERFVSVDITR